jgi:four helix bundle protein
MAINSFRELRVWQSGMDLVEQVYLVTRVFPQQEVYGLTSQMRCSAVSIPSNIAEGHTREHLKEYLHHISMTQASLAELETQIEISLRLEYLPTKQAQEIIEKIGALGRQLYTLRNSLSKTN